MTEKYEVMNATRGAVSFRVHPDQSVEDLNAMAGHHRRKAIRSAAVNVTIPHGIAYDLVEKTGLTIKELKNSPELHKLLKGGSLSLLKSVEIIVEDPPVVEESVVEEPPLPPVVDESPPLPSMVVEIPVVDEPEPEKKKISKKKTKR